MKEHHQENFVKKNTKNINWGVYNFVSFLCLNLAQGTDVLLIAAGIGREYGGGGV
jgi:hypothetical protein